MPILAADIPLKGMVTDRLGKRLGPGEATDLLNTWREVGELRVRPGFSQFSTAPDTLPVQTLFTAEFAGGTRSFVRFDEDRLYNYSGSSFTEIMPAAPATFGGTATQPFGVAMVLNRMVFSNGVAADGVWEWSGVGDATQIANAGVLVDHDAFRYVAPFASRVIGAYTSGTNGAVTVIGSALGSTTDWTVVNGAFVAVRNEHPSPITGLTTDDNNIFVWKERAIVTGVKTGDDDRPIDWALLRTEGVGALAARSILPYGGLQFALSHEGFFVLAGGQLQFVDTDIKRDMFRRLNFGALRQIHGVPMPEFGKVVWFVPEGSDTYPRAAWVYDTFNQGWDRWETALSITASSRAFLSTGRAIDTYTANPGELIDGSPVSSLIIDTLGTGASSPTYILGDSNGRTYYFDFAGDDDNGDTFVFAWESPDVRFDGGTDDATGAPINALSVVTLDRVTVEYNHSGSSASLECSVSTNGGQTYTTLQTKTISATSSHYTYLDFWGRVSGNQFRIRLRISPVLGVPRFRNLTIAGGATGERR